MNYGDALDVLKQGFKVRRTGWNGKGMFLVLVEGGDWQISRVPESLEFLREILPNLEMNKNAPRKLPWIGIRTADNCFVPWLASQTDQLAEDWELVNHIEPHIVSNVTGQVGLGITSTSHERSSVLEEAAKACEKQIETDERRGRMQSRSILTRCAATIRALVTHE